MKMNSTIHLTELRTFIFARYCRIQLSIYHLSQKDLWEFQVLEWITSVSKDCSEKNLKNTPSSLDLTVLWMHFHAYSAIQIGRGNNNSTYFSLVILSLRSTCITITSQGGKCKRPIFFQIQDSRELALYSQESKIRDFPGNIFRNNKRTLFSNPGFPGIKSQRCPGIFLGNIIINN